MRRDLWPLKAFFALSAVCVGVSDLSFSGPPISPSILFLLGVLLAFDAWNDRDLKRVEQHWAEENRAARVAAIQVEAKSDKEEQEREFRYQQRIFAAGKQLGFLFASHANNEDLLRLSVISPEMRQKLEAKQKIIKADVASLLREYGWLQAKPNGS